ncbi:hypothetical protein KKF55_04035 [Patescibacteria group bacterium]|nr:hypothetical protein [Patescibacteria group bacterium]
MAGKQGFGGQAGLGLRTSDFGLSYVLSPMSYVLSDKKNFMNKVRSGYTFLLSVLFVGAIAIAVTGTMLLLGWLTLRNAQIVEQSGRSFELAMTCAEHGLIELFEDGNYMGGEELTASDGACNILRTGGSGNENRTLCTEGMSGGSTRRFEIIIERILPSISIFAWQEVELFTSCEY